MEKEPKSEKVETVFNDGPVKIADASSGEASKGRPNTKGSAVESPFSDAVCKEKK